MERLATTCQVLYDKDLLDKQKQIVKMKKELNDNILPKIIYENMEEWENLKTEAIKICQEGVEGFLRNTEYPFMRDFGINPGQHNDLGNIFLEAVTKISKGQANEWVSNYAVIVNLTIKNTIMTLLDMEVWETLFDVWGWNGMKTFISKILIAFFDEELHGMGPWDTIAVIRYFKCSSCNKLFDEVCDCNS